MQTNKRNFFKKDTFTVALIENKYLKVMEMS